VLNLTATSLVDIPLGPSNLETYLQTDEEFERVAVEMVSSNKIV
jgi:hypothetical protein